MKSISRRIFKDSLIVTLFGVVGQALGFVAMMMIAKMYGANWITDAYYMAFIIPGTFTGIMFGLIKIVFVPFFVEERIKNPENVRHIFNMAISAMMICSIIGMIAVALLSYLNILSFGQNPEGKALTQILIFELLPLIPLTIISGVLSAIYNSYQRFGLEELANLLRYIAVIPALILLTGYMGIHALVLGHVAGQLLTLLFSAWLVYKKLGLSFRFHFTFSSDFKRILRSSILPFLSYSMALFNPLISRIVASFLDAGSITIITYAQRIALIPSLVIGSGFLGVLVSHWSKSSVEGKDEQLQRSVIRSFSMMITIITPIVIGLYVLREPLIRLLLQRGAFNENAVVVTAGVFSIFVVAVIPTYLHRLVGRVLFVKQDMISLFLVTCLGVGIHLLLTYVLAIILDMGPSGIALSTLISITVVSCTTIFIVHDKYIRFSVESLGGNIFKTLIGCMIMFFGIYLFHYFSKDWLLNHSLLFEIIGTGIIGGSIYMGFLWLVNHPDFIVISEMGLNMIKKKKHS